MAGSPTGSTFPTVPTRGLPQPGTGETVANEPLGFFGSQTPAAKQTVTGSKGANAALTSLIAALVAYGLITDTTS